MAKANPVLGGFTVPSSAGLITTQTFQGLTGGLNLSNPAHELPDSQARYMQDILLDNLGIIRLRGPLTQVTGVPSNSGLAGGLISMVSPDGGLGVVQLDFATGGSSVVAVKALNAALTSWTSIGSITTAGTGNPNALISDMHPAISGETLIGFAFGYKNAAGYSALWGGSRRANYSTGTVTATQGSVNVTGSGTTWTTNVDAGSYLFNSSGIYIGRVQSVSTNTAIILTTGALFAIAGAAYSIQSTRTFFPCLAKGRITGGTNGTTLSGGDTKFTMLSSTAQWTTNLGLTWTIYRLPEYTFVGTVSSVTNDTALTLTANAAINVSNDRYVAVGSSVLDQRGYVNLALGFLSTTYQQRQFYANNPNSRFGTAATKTIARVWFSEPLQPEFVDMTDSDGDFFDVGSQAAGTTPVTALAGMQNALAIFKENELWTFLGNDPSNFSLRKVADTGTWSNGSVQVFQNMVIFASRLGIQAFDGANISTLSAELGSYWQNGVKLASKQMRSFIHRDHYILYVPDFNETFLRYKGSVGVLPTSATFVINLSSGAITKFTNFGIGGGTALPPSFALGSWFIGNDSTPNTYTFDADSVFATTGTDAIQLQSDTSLGPDFYMETKKYDGRDAERKKLWKQMMMDYYAKGDTLSMDTITGLTTSAGTTTAIPWPIQLDFTNFRLKFLKRSTHISFRLYETNGTLQDAQIGPWGLGFKFQRPGRV